MHCCVCKHLPAKDCLASVLLLLAAAIVPHFIYCCILGLFGDHGGTPQRPACFRLPWFVNLVAPPPPPPRDFCKKSTIFFFFCLFLCRYSLPPITNIVINHNTQHRRRRRRQTSPLPPPNTTTTTMIKHRSNRDNTATSNYISWAPPRARARWRWR